MYPQIKTSPNSFSDLLNKNSVLNQSESFMWNYGVQSELWMRLFLHNDFVSEDEVQKLLAIFESNRPLFSSRLSNLVKNFNVTLISNACSLVDIPIEWRDRLFEENHGFNVCGEYSNVEYDSDWKNNLKTLNDEGRCLIQFEHDLGIDRVWCHSNDFADLIISDRLLAECYFWILNASGSLCDVLSEYYHEDGIWYLEDFDWSLVPENGSDAPVEAWLKAISNGLMGGWGAEIRSNYESEESFEVWLSENNLVKKVKDFKVLKDFMADGNKTIKSAKEVLIYLQGQPKSIENDWAITAIKSLIKINEQADSIHNRLSESETLYLESLELNLECQLGCEAQYLFLSRFFHMLADRGIMYGSGESCLSIYMPKPEQYKWFDLVIKQTIIGHAILMNCPLLSQENY